MNSSRHAVRLKRRVIGNPAGMPRRPVGGGAKAPKIRDCNPYALASISKRSDDFPPRGNHYLGVELLDIPNEILGGVFRPKWIACLIPVLRLGSAESTDIQLKQAAITKALCEADVLAHSSIIFDFVSCGRIRTDIGHDWEFVIPDADKPVAVFSVRREVSI